MFPAIHSKSKNHPDTKTIPIPKVLSRQLEVGGWRPQTSSIDISPFGLVAYWFEHELNFRSELRRKYLIVVSGAASFLINTTLAPRVVNCLLYTSDAADE